MVSPLARPAHSLSISSEAHPRFGRTKKKRLAAQGEGEREREKLGLLAHPTSGAPSTRVGDPSQQPCRRAGMHIIFLIACRLSILFPRARLSRVYICIHSLCRGTDTILSRDSRRLACLCALVAYMPYIYCIESLHVRAFCMCDACKDVYKL